MRWIVDVDVDRKLTVIDRMDSKVDNVQDQDQDRDRDQDQP